MDAHTASDTSLSAKGAQPTDSSSETSSDETSSAKRSREQLEALVICARTNLGAFKEVYSHSDYASNKRARMQELAADIINDIENLDALCSFKNSVFEEDDNEECMQHQKYVWKQFAEAFKQVMLH